MYESEIQQLLNQIRIILEHRQVKFWADYFADLERELSKAEASRNQNRKRQVLQKINEIYGGMGSFNDVFINARAGHNIKPDEESHVNQELDKLSTRLYELVREEKPQSS